ncbi:MAG: hypothetical protein QXF26_09215 [Candidatus Bathyarchaeia archaeon]
MPKRRRKRSITIATIAAVGSAFLASPLDDLLFWSLMGKTFLTLPWSTSILLGTALGLIVYLILQKRNSR